MAIDVSRFRNVLNNTKLQKNDEALYQLLSQIIDVLEEKQVQVSTEGIVSTYDIDTSTSPQTIRLNQYVRGLTIIKDVSGNALVNNITLIGTVDGVVNPVINTNYGSKRLIRNTKTGEYHEV